MVCAGAETGGGALTVTCAVASAVPESPRATKWYVVEAAGVTVCVPLVGTVPMPSIDVLVASVVCQLRVTWSPAVICEGVAVICAVGAGADGGAVTAGGGGCFFLQPATATKATSRTTGTRIRERRIKVWLLLRHPNNAAILSLGAGIAALQRRFRLPELCADCVIVKCAFVFCSGPQATRTAPARPDGVVARLSPAQQARMEIS